MDITLKKIKETEDITKRREILRNNYFNNSVYITLEEAFSNGRSNIEVTDNMLKAGVKIIKYREKENKNKSIKNKYDECVKIRELTRQHNALFIVNDYIDLAIATRADGVHIGEKDLPIDVVRKIVGYDMIIGFSTESKSQILKATIDNKADYISIGPIFEKNSKDSLNKHISFEYIKYTESHFKIPFVCYGGITLENIDLLINSNALSISMIDVITDSEDIKKKCELIIRKMKKF